MWLDRTDLHVSALCWQAEHASWFDIVTWPISLGELEPPHGLDAAIAAVQRTLDQLVAEGFESSRIVVGGFSQVS